MTSPLAYPTRPPQPYAAPPQEDDQSQRAALYIQGIGWSTPAAVSPRRAPAGSGAVGSSPLGRQSSIMPDWSVAEDANTDQVQQLIFGLSLLSGVTSKATLSGA